MRKKILTNKGNIAATLNELVQNGMPFRDTYKKMGQEINEGTFTPKRDIKHSHEGSLGNLCLKEIKDKMNEIRG